MIEDAPLSPGYLAFDGVGKRFGSVLAVDGVSLDVRRGEFFSLLGPSGCGKSTLMRMVAGFETPDEGRILLDGADLAAAPPHLRPVNMMFQSYALFPHLSVRDNIAFGLRAMGQARDVIDRRVAEMVALTQLEGLEARKPEALSGGQRQRVALARALARAPKVLLLDEPLAALDRKLRKDTQGELKRIQAETGATFLVVTHDQEEAMALSDRMAVMDRGRIVQVGTPSEVYNRPENGFTAGFLGEINLLPAIHQANGRWRINGVETPLEIASASLASQGKAVLALRPERLAIDRGQPLHGQPGWDVTLRSRTLLGHAVSLDLVTDHGLSLQALVPAGHPTADARVGERLRASFDPAAARVIGA